MKRLILVADEDHRFVASTSEWLQAQGYQTLTATESEMTLRLINERTPDLLLCGSRLADCDGVSFAENIRSLQNNLPILMFATHLNENLQEQAAKCGIAELLTKPFRDHELFAAFNRIFAARANSVQLNSDASGISNLPFSNSQFNTSTSFVLEDPRMLEIQSVIDCVADTRSTVLITGESGTGKSLIAKSIHEKSSRREQPFVNVTCGALAENLLESELFGHVEGAFTGAIATKPGKFQQAHLGTIFLDEISTASAAMQVKLLRVLQEYSFEPVGSTQTISVDSRVILATNERLEELVTDGRFRQDLYYRINVITLELPPLRERLMELPLLIDHFLEKICHETGKAVSGFTTDALSCLQSYQWPGNIRELENVIERCVLLSKQSWITARDLPSNLKGNTETGRPRSSCTLKEALAGPERQIILSSLAEHGWNRNLTADALGINRTTLYKKMKRLGLEESALCPSLS